VLVEPRGQVVYPGAGGGHRGDDGRLPVPRRPLRQGDHPAQIADGFLGSRLVGLVHHEHVTDLQDAGLGGLDGITQARRDDHQGGIGQRGDLDLGLAHPHRFYQQDVEAGRVQHPQRLRRGAGQPAQMTPAGHGPDEDAIVGGVPLHPDPVAQQGAAGEG
jgi:hypothetical protein